MSQTKKPRWLSRYSDQFTGWTTEQHVSFLARDKRHFLLQIIHSYSAAHVASFLMGIEASSQRARRPGCEGNHTPPSFAHFEDIYICLLRSWHDAKHLENCILPQSSLLFSGTQLCDSQKLGEMNCRQRRRSLPNCTSSRLCPYFLLSTFFRRVLKVCDVLVYSYKRILNIFHRRETHCVFLIPFVFLQPKTQRASYL